MEVSFRSFAFYAASCGLFLVVAVVGAALWTWAGGRTAGAAKPKPADGHLLWAEGEMAQFAADGGAERRRLQSTFDTALFRAELEIEARRIIVELSRSRGAGALTMNVEKAVARGLRLTTFYKANFPPARERGDQVSYFQELRRAADREEGRAAVRKGAHLQLVPPPSRVRDRT